MDSSMFSGGLASLLSGIFGHSNQPYDRAQEEYNKWINKGADVQQPYVQAGQGAIGNYQDWLNKQKDPSEFINNLTKNYKESDYAHGLQQQAMNAANNSASASGLTGSSALLQQEQQNAGQIASQDMNQWLQNVLGINTQYGQGQNNLISTGQNSANKLTDLYNQAGQQNAGFNYNSNAGKQNDFWNTIAGGLGLGLSFL